MTNASVNFTTKISLDVPNGIARINFDDREGYTRTFGSFREQITELKALRKSFQVIVPQDSDLAVVAGFRTEAKQRRAKSQRQRLIDRIARLRCGLLWDVAKQYVYEGEDLERWNAAREDLKGLNLVDLRRVEGVAMKLQVIGKSAPQKSSEPSYREKIAAHEAQIHKLMNVIPASVTAR